MMEILCDDIIGYSVNSSFYGVSEFVLRAEFLVICGYFSTVKLSPPSISGVSKIGLHQCTQKTFVHGQMEPDF